MYVIHSVHDDEEVYDKGARQVAKQAGQRVKSFDASSVGTMAGYAMMFFKILLRKYKYVTDK